LRGDRLNTKLVRELDSNIFKNLKTKFKTKFKTTFKEKFKEKLISCGFESDSWVEAYISDTMKA
jgi:hypothetical protein